MLWADLTVTFDQLNVFLLKTNINFYNNLKILLTLNFWTMVYVYGI